METFLIKAVQLMLAFAILVTFHEFGHYLFSRIFGVRVEKFYLFFNPWFTLFKYKPKRKDNNPNKSSWRDTEYGIGWLPLGGYVKIAGMIDESMDKEQMQKPAQPWEFRSKPALQRLLIMVAGVVFNFILAIIIYASIVFSWGEEFIRFRDATQGMEYSEAAHNVGFQDGDIPLFADGDILEYPSNDVMLKMVMAKQVNVLRNSNDTVSINIPEDFAFRIENETRDNKFFMYYSIPVVVSEIEKGKGAAEAGLLKGDQIVSVNNTPTASFSKFTKELMAHKGETVGIQYLRNNKLQNSDIKISEGGKIGIMLTPISDIYPVEYVKYSFLESIPRGIEMGVDKLVGYVSQMKLIFTKEGAQSIGGFGAIGNIFPETWDWLQFWNITAFLSVILAFMNILPIPALDGGHVFFLLYEIITRRQPSEKFLEYAQMAGMAFLFALLIYANGNDIYRFFFK
ncbi:MAG: RIP metalloprotease RseP [Muribaculaceae bacterium]|nr:RIP metalloprotease RseP [Muribaculaceae bacterium]